MHFKGDIIITDPCYIVKERYDYLRDPTYPKWDDFFIDDKGNPIRNLGTFIKESVDSEHKKFRTAWVEMLREKYENAENEWKFSHKELMKDDWEDCNYGEDMDILGIKTYLTSDTMYGDWSCTTYEKGTNNELGHFCADAGMVSVFLLDEVLAYNPDYDDHIKRPWTTTLIKDFDGDIEIEVVDIEYDSDEEDEDECRVDEEVRVIGNGNVNFYTTQTGF